MSNDITKKTILDSGLRVLTGHVSDQATNYYDIRVTVDSGFSDDEIDGQAHFLEHMAFNGIEKFNGIVDYKTLRQERDKNGVFFGAYTTPVKTCYTARVPVNLGQDGLHNALDELASMVIRPALPEDRIAHEKKVISNEWGHRQGAIPIYLYEQSQINGFRSNPAFGHRGLGEKKDIRDINRQNLMNFIADYYTQPNTSVVVTGPVDHEQVVQSVEKTFADMPTNIRPDYPEETPLEDSYIVKEIDFIPHNFFVTLIPWPGDIDYEDEAANHLASLVINRRLNNNIREEMGDVYGLSTGFVRFRQEGFFMIDTSTEPETTPKVIRNIAFELQQVANGNITEEFDAVVKMMVNGLKSSLTDSGRLADDLSNTESSFRHLHDVNHAIDAIQSATVEDVQALVRRVLAGSVVFSGLGQENTFLPEAELKAIFSLPQPGSDISLKGRFKPDVS